MFFPHFSKIFFKDKKYLPANLQNIYFFDYPFSKKKDFPFLRKKIDLKKIDFLCIFNLIFKLNTSFQFSTVVINELTLMTTDVVYKLTGE